METETTVPSSGAFLPAGKEPLLFFLSSAALFFSSLFAHAVTAAAFLSPLCLVASVLPLTLLFFGKRRLLPLLAPLPALLAALLWLRDPVFALLVAAAAVTSGVMAFSVRREFSAFEAVSFSALASSVLVGGALFLWIFLLAEKEGTDARAYLSAAIDGYVERYLLLFDSLKEAIPSVSAEAADGETLRSAITAAVRVLPAYLAAILYAGAFFRLRLLLSLLRRLGVETRGQEIWLPPVGTAVLFFLSVVFSFFLSPETAAGLTARYLTVLLTLPMAAVGIGVLAGIFLRGRPNKKGAFLLIVVLIALFTQLYFLYLLALFGSAARLRIARAGRGE